MTNNDQIHEEALRQKELDSNQLLEYIKYNELTKNSKLETELSAILENKELGLSDKAKKEVARCIQLSKGYTEYKVADIAENTGFNRTRTKALIQYLLQNQKVETVSLENTTFLKIV